MPSRLRLNRDIIGIILHHSTHESVLSGKVINSNYVAQGDFGIPYDVIINGDGTLDLSPRWIYASRSDQYLSNVSVRDIARFGIHHVGGIGETDEYNKNYIHIGVIGDFDSKRPKPIQIARLEEVLKEIAKKFYIDLRLNFFYHRDLVKTSCPGIYFPNKWEVIKEIPVYSRPVITYDRATPPLPPILISPLDEEIGVPLIPTLVWEESVGAVLYSIEVALDSEFTNIVYSNLMVNTTEEEIGLLIHSTEYFWRVNARNAAGTSGWSEIWSFTTVIYYEVLVTAFVPL